MQEPKPTRGIVRIIKKIVVATIIGIGFFFGGLFCALISPLIAILSLLYTPTAAVTQKFKTSWEDTLKELQDPDYKEKWKRDHDDLYNEDKDKDNQ